MSNNTEKSTLLENVKYDVIPDPHHPNKLSGMKVWSLVTSVILLLGLAGSFAYYTLFVKDIDPEANAIKGSIVESNDLKNIDNDNDGLGAVAELENGTSDNKPDSDTDSIPDKYEVEHNLNPLSDSDNSVDRDKDGLSSKQEHKYNTDPNNPDTDADGYLDGEEVEHGFNPTGEGKL